MAWCRLRSTLRGGRWVPFYDPASDPIHELAERHRGTYRAIEAAVWTLAVALDVGTLAATQFGVASAPLVERGPISGWMITRFGLPGLVVEHRAAFAVLAGVWLVLPRPYRLIVPIASAWAGYVVVLGYLGRLASNGLLAVPW